MKRVFALALVLALTCGLAACSSPAESAPEESASSVPPQSAAASEQEETASVPETEEEESEPSSSQPGAGSNILIAYFTMPENVDTTGVDAVAGASIVVNGGEAMGNVEYMAGIIQATVGGDLFQIETVQQYPMDHDPLVDQAAQEQDENARPELASQIENLDQYDTIFLGYPNWWGDLPMPLYTFLEEYDFSGKTIIPFCPHGGSGFSQTESTIAELQPNAVVSENGLTVSRNDVADSAQEITAWAEGLGL